MFCVKPDVIRCDYIGLDTIMDFDNFTKLCQQMNIKDWTTSANDSRHDSPLMTSCFQVHHKQTLFTG